MGMFDTVDFECPNCHQQLQVQSKAGPCNLGTYYEKAVPLSIASDLNGDKEECPGCHTKLVLKLKSSNTVPMHLVPAKYVQDDDEDEEY
jgi:ssDNA-binding Zn-finger/Zn-ribbon topoisomerase 1